MKKVFGVFALMALLVSGAQGVELLGANVGELRPTLEGAIPTGTQLAVGFKAMEGTPLRVTMGAVDYDAWVFQRRLIPTSSSMVASCEFFDYDTKFVGWEGNNRESFTLVAPYTAIWVLSCKYEAGDPEFTHMSILKDDSVLTVEETGFLWAD